MLTPEYFHQLKQLINHLYDCAGNEPIQKARAAVLHDKILDMLDIVFTKGVSE